MNIDSLGKPCYPDLKNLYILADTCYIAYLEFGIKISDENTYIIPDIGIMVRVRVFANGPGDLGSVPGRVIPKTQKMVLDASLLYTQHYKVRIKGKMQSSKERSNALPYTLV